MDLKNDNRFIFLLLCIFSECDIFVETKYVQTWNSVKNVYKWEVDGGKKKSKKDSHLVIYSVSLSNINIFVYK